MFKQNQIHSRGRGILAHTIGENWQPCFCDYEYCVPMVLQIGKSLLNDLAKLQNFRWCVFFGKYCHCFVIPTLRTHLHFFSFPPCLSSVFVLGIFNQSIQASFIHMRSSGRKGFSAFVKDLRYVASSSVSPPKTDWSKISHGSLSYLIGFDHEMKCFSGNSLKAPESPLTEFP